MSVWKARRGTIGLGMVGDTCKQWLPDAVGDKVPPSCLDSPASPELSVLHPGLSALWESDFLVIS